jgi:hypothetical protein
MVDALITGLVFIALLFLVLSTGAYWTGIYTRGKERLR